MSKISSHNELGRELELFDTFEDAGSGHVFWKPRGYKIFSNLSKWIEFEHKKRGYLTIKTPIIYRSHLWETSGHKQMYSDFMYLFRIKKEDMDEEWGIKPMNCPAHILLFKSKRRFEKDLPLKFFELGLVHRHELSGVINGLLRVRSFTQDDSHIFVKKNQIGKVVKEVIEFVRYVFKMFEIENIKFFLSTMPEKHLGNENVWREVERMMEDALKDAQVNYEINPGEGAFYGPKIDVEIKDAHGRLWQLSTIQIDFNLPERFDIKYYKDDGSKERVYIIHRAILGSLERFIGIMLEHFQGKLPLLFAPYQIAIIPVKNTPKEVEYAMKIKDNIESITNLMVEVDILSQEKTVSKRILMAEKKKYVYILVIGEKEVDENKVAIRNENMTLNDFLSKIKGEYEKWFSLTNF